MTMAVKKQPEPQPQRLDDYVGWTVEAADGRKVGKVAKATYDTDREHFVVKTSMLGRGVELHSDDIVAVDAELIRLGITAEEVRERPKYVQQRGSAEASEAGNHVIPL